MISVGPSDNLQDKARELSYGHMFGEAMVGNHIKEVTQAAKFGLIDFLGVGYLLDLKAI